MTSINGKTMTAGLIGWPVSHSQSPRLHGFWLARHGIDGAYLPLPVAPGRLEAALRGLPALGFKGANVTVPHKEAVCRAVDTLSETAERIGAVNTIVCNEDGTLFGDNTDAFGFMASLQAGAPDWTADAAPAVLLGAGGAARAVISALTDAGIPEIRVCNRTRARAEDLARHFGAPVTVVDWDERSQALAGAGLLVNTTSLGMSGSPPLDIALDRLGTDAVVIDAVYAPLETDLLKGALARGLTAVDGLGMLLHQGTFAFEAWFGVRPAVDEELRRFILAGRH